MKIRGTLVATQFLALAPSVANAQGNWCGTVWGNAKKCRTPCPGGVDSECPLGETCFAAVPCITKDNAYCGSTFPNAHSCGKACIGGTDQECPSGQKCYGDVRCGISNRNWCGNEFEDATTTCSTACPVGLDQECPSGQTCYAQTSCGTTSPKPPPSSSGGGPACFSAKAMVQVKNKGTVAMEDLQIGDEVLVDATIYDAGFPNYLYEPVYAFGHLDRTKTATFQRIYTNNHGNPLEITPNHLVYLAGQANPIAAGSLKVGDVLHGEQGLPIHKISTITRQDGIYAPFTPSGKIMVDGILASNYVSLQKSGGDEYPEMANGVSLPWSTHYLLHMGMAPLRMMCMGISPALCNHNAGDSKPVWVDGGMRLATFADEQNNIVTQLLMVAVFLLLLGPLYVMELMLGGPKYAPLAVLVISAAMATMRAHFPWKQHKKAKGN